MVAARKKSLIKNPIATDEMGRVYVMVTRNPDGTNSEGSEFFTIVDEGAPAVGNGRVYKYTFNRAAALKSGFFSDTSTDSSAYGTGVTQTCSVTAQAFAKTVDIAPLFASTELFTAIPSIPTIESDGSITFYVLAYYTSYVAGFHLRLILSSQYVNAMRS